MLENEEIFKIDKGFYSDEKFYNYLELFVKKYPNAIFTSESAFFFWRLIDYIPEKEFVTTQRKAKPIIDDSVVQIFSTEEYFYIGKTIKTHNNVVVNIYDKEIIANYRAMVDELDISKLARYLKIFKNGDNIFETIHREVF